MTWRMGLVVVVALVAGVSSSFAGTVDATIPSIDAALASGGPVLVEVAAPWCVECQVEKPIIEGMLARPEFQSMSRVLVDFDSQRDILRHLQVQSESTLIVYKGGKEVDRMIGATDPAVIEALLREAL